MKKALITLAASILAIVPATPSEATASGSQRQCGGASFYGGNGDGYAWKTTASGSVMNPQAMTTAHRHLPFGTLLKVTNQQNGRSVTVRVNDRGPFVGGRVLDLSYGAFARIASTGQGITRVCYSII